MITLLAPGIQKRLQFKAVAEPTTHQGVFIDSFINIQNKEAFSTGRDRAKQRKITPGQIYLKASSEKLE